MDLAEFLLARIAEDEAKVEHMKREAHRAATAPIFQSNPPNWLTGVDIFVSPARWAAECEAKRRMIGFALRHGSAIDSEFGCCHDEDAILTGFRDWGDGDDPEPVPDGCLGVQAAQEGLLILATPYADHPDYRSDWSL